MTAGGAAFVLGSLLQAAAPQVVMLVVGRVMLGIGIGFANQVPPRAPHLCGADSWHVVQLRRLWHLKLWCC